MCAYCAYNPFSIIDAPCYRHRLPSALGEREGSIFSNNQHFAVCTGICGVPCPLPASRVDKPLVFLYSNLFRCSSRSRVGVYSVIYSQACSPQAEISPSRCNLHLLASEASRLMFMSFEIRDTYIYICARNFEMAP